MEGDTNFNSASTDTTKNMLSFKDIRKQTMNETYQNLHSVIQTKGILESGKPNELISSSSSLSLFDESLRLMAIDCLKLEKEVFRILLSQNDYQIKRILRCSWYFRTLKSEFCISEIFPFVSYSVRCKIITNLSKYLESEVEAEKYFTYIRQNYSNQRADFLLPKCSDKFILNNFEKHHFLFNYPAGARILLNICRRHVEVGLHILNRIFEWKKTSDLVKFKNVFHYLAGNHTELFVPFLKKHYSEMGLEIFGWKLTKKLGRVLQECLYTEFDSTAVFKAKPLFLCLSFENKIKFLAGSVGQGKTPSLDYWIRSSSNMCEVLKLVQPEDRLKMIEGAFKELYNLNFNEHSKCWSAGLLELLPLNTRLPFVRKLDKYFEADRTVFTDNMNNSFSIDHPERFIYLYDFETAFAKFKQLLRSAPQPSKRQSIVQNMVKNCSINSDVTGLQEVVDFVVLKHRNDESSVLYDFVDNICSEFSWTAINPLIFEKVEDLLNFCSKKGNSHSHLQTKWKEWHIYQLLEKGLDVKAHVKDLLGVVFESCAYRCVDDIKCKHSRTLLLSLGEMAIEWLLRNPSEDDRSRCLLYCVLQTCADFNELNKENKIVQEIPGLFDIAKERLEKGLKDLGADKWPLDIFERYPVDVESARYTPKCLLYVLKQRPELIESHLEGFTKCLVEYYHKRFSSFLNYFIKTVSFFGKMEELKEILLMEFHKEKSPHARTAIELYSYVSTIEEFTEAVKDYVPSHEKIKTESDQDFGKTQFLIPSYIKNVRPRWKNFDLLFKFFEPDFFKKVIPSLQACSLHTRVDVVVPFLREKFSTLSKRVSYQKEIIRLIAMLCKREERNDFCLKCWDDYKHYSIRTILLLFISNEFVEQPTDKSFQALKKCILQSDSNIIVQRPSFQKIPGEFLEEYVSALLKFSESQAPAFRDDFQQLILAYFNRDNIHLLSPGFCEKIIKDNLFNSSSRLEVMELTYVYIMADPNAMEERLGMVFELIKDAKPSWKSVSSFLHILLRTSSADRTLFADMLTFVLNNWPKFPLGVLYEDRLLFTYHSLYQKVLQRTVDPELVPAEFAKEIKKLCSNTNNFKDLVVVFAEELKKFFVEMKTVDAIFTVKTFVTEPKDRSMAVMGILALPEEALGCFRNGGEIFDENTMKSKTALNDLIGVLQSYNDEVIEIFMRRELFG